MYAKNNKIVIFLDLFNVHTQYIPFDGIIKNIEIIEGPANLANDLINSEYNKSIKVTIDTNIGDIIVYQRVGFFVRRIINYINIGDQVNRSNIYGRITFGSRVDIILPTSIKTNLTKGQEVIGGVTPLF